MTNPANIIMFEANVKLLKRGRVFECEIRDYATHSIVGKTASTDVGVVISWLSGQLRLRADEVDLAAIEAKQAKDAEMDADFESAANAFDPQRALVEACEADEDEEEERQRLEVIENEIGQAEALIDH